jgi:hypothetical protein
VATARPAPDPSARAQALIGDVATGQWNDPLNRWGTYFANERRCVSAQAASLGSVVRYAPSTGLLRAFSQVSILINQASCTRGNYRLGSRLPGSHGAHPGRALTSSMTRVGRASGEASLLCMSRVSGLGTDGGRKTLATDPVLLDLPFRGRWLARNSPARHVPSHGTHAFGLTYAIDFIAVDQHGRSAPRTWRTFLSVEPPEVFRGFGEPILTPGPGRSGRS